VARKRVRYDQQSKVVERIKHQMTVLDWNAYRLAAELAKLGGPTTAQGVYRWLHLERFPDAETLRLVEQALSLMPGELLGPAGYIFMPDTGGLPPFAAVVLKDPKLDPDEARLLIDMYERLTAGKDGQEQLPGDKQTSQDRRS
jgi:hypothetical protein